MAYHIKLAPQRVTTEIIEARIETRYSDCCGQCTLCRLIEEQIVTIELEDNTQHPWHKA